MRIVIGLIVALFLGSVTNVVAQEKPTFAIVDMNLLVRDSIAGKLILENFQRIENNYVNSYKAEESKIAARQQELRKQQEDLASDDKEAQTALVASFRETEAKARRLRSLFDTNMRTIQADKTKAMNTFQQRIQQIVNDMRKQYGLLMVLDARFIVAIEAEIDITQDAMDKINQEVPTVEFKMAEQVEGDQAPVQ